MEAKDKIGSQFSDKERTEQYMREGKTFREFYNGVECLFMQRPFGQYEVRPLRQYDTINEVPGHSVYLITPSKEPDDLEILNTESYRAEFPNLSDSDIMWSQHQIILNQKKEIAELREALYGHHTKCLNENY